MKVLSLFDGMACGMLAMRGAGVQVDRYVAFETDPYAVQTSSYNFPAIEHRGDVFEADFTEFPGFDFLVGGSPCTYWSIAQKNNRETEASGMGWELFSQYVRALHEAAPKFFIYENNKSMSKAIRASIDKAFGFEAVCINSALVSAQNRQRLYWVGKRNSDGTYRRVEVKQPEDLDIIVKDVLEWPDAEPINLTKEGKARTLRATSYKDGIRNMIGNDVDRKTCVAVPVSIDSFAPGEVTENSRLEFLGGIVGNHEKWLDDGKAYSRNFSQGHLLYGINGKATTLTAQGCGYAGHTGLYAVPVQAGGKRYPIYEVRGGVVTIKGKRYPIKLADGFYVFRKLTVAESKRLQTVPDEYVFPVSNTQAYKMLGNGWTVDVVKHLILSALTEEDWLL